VDLDAWRSANQPTWSLTLDGYEYKAHPVSAVAVARLVETLGKAGPSQQLALYRSLFRLAFPWVPSYVWRGDPVAKIMALSPAAFREVRDDFFGHLGAQQKPHAPATSTTP
jgi:hypothetical protein